VKRNFPHQQAPWENPNPRDREFPNWARMDLQRFASREIMAAEEDKEAYKEVCSEEAGMG
jgi:hypothetical protein